MYEDEHAARGGRYLVDPKTGKRTLVLCTEQPKKKKPVSQETPMHVPAPREPK